MKRLDRIIGRVCVDKNRLVRTALGFFLIPLLCTASQASEPYIQVTTETITVVVEDVSLGDVLTTIQSKSGIGFDVPYSMRTERIVAHVQADDWKNVLRELLEDYSRIDVWDGDRLRNVYLLKSNRSADIFPADNSDAEGGESERKKSPSPPVESEILLTEDQARKLFSGKFRSPLAVELLEDKELQPFLDDFGIEHEEDLKDLEKTSKVRREARRQFLLLKKNARLQKSDPKQ